jgi:hypothetical protein
MPCQHQTQLYQLLEKTGVKLASSDVIRITCRQCGEIEVCPSVMLDEYEKTKVDDDEKNQNTEKKKSGDE